MRPAEQGGQERLSAGPEPFRVAHWQFPWRLLAILVLSTTAIVAGVYFWPTAWSSMQKQAAMKEFVFEPNINRPGDDYTHFALRDARPEACAAECAKDTNCMAFTFVPASVKGASAHCYLKSGTPAPLPVPCCVVSGVKAR